jgi:signal transduction histidine kinase
MVPVNLKSKHRAGWNTFRRWRGSAYLDAVSAVRIPGGIRPIDVAATAVVIAAVELNIATATGPSQKPLTAMAYLAGAVLPLPILLRRRWPLRELLGCAILMFFYYIFDRRNISPAPLLCLPLYDATVAGYLVWAIVIPAFFMTVGFFVVDASTHQGVGSVTAEFLESIAVLFLAVALGEVVRSRRALAAETADRLRLAAEERDAEAARRVAEERLRIARDLHDTIAHSMATITVQAGSALHVLDSAQASRAQADGAQADGAQADGAQADGAQADGAQADGAQADGARAAPDGLRDSLAAIRETSKNALTDIRATLGRLRREDDEGDVGKRAGDGQPAQVGEGGIGRRVGGLDGLPALADAVTAAGAPVRLTIEGERAALPAPVDQAAYRILQEALTNVLRHAGREATATVQLNFGPDALTIRVTDDGDGDGDRQAGAECNPAAVDGGIGHGITGMTERATALGGELTAGPRPEGGFEILARLPTTPNRATA